MIKALFIIRLKQIYRAVIEIGLIRIILLFGLVGLFGYLLYAYSSDIKISLMISIGFLSVLTLIQLNRKDKLFLKSHFSNYKILLLFEYFLLSIPVIVCLLIHKQWSSLILFSGLLAIIHLDYRAKYSTLNSKLQRLIPSDSFEWKAGVRKLSFTIASIWIIAAATSFFIGSVPMAIVTLGILIFSFFENCEPYQILLSYELSPRKLLFLKVKRQFQLYSALVIPLIGLSVIFNTDRWYLPVIIYLIFCFIHMYLIMAKYAFFKPNCKSPASQTLGSIGAVAGFVPIFLPLIWILTIWLYIKSINNLKSYLNDYN